MTDVLELDVNGVRTVVETIGEGAPVLFLHGAATIEGFDFAEGLAGRFRVLLPSHPGFGRSGDAPHVAGMADLVVHYLNLLDALNLEQKPHLMGFSMGGWMAAELAAVAREKFDRVVFVAPAGIAHPAYPPADLGAIAPQDFPAHLAHDVNVALRYFPNPPDEQATRAFGAERQREGEALGRILGPFGFGHPNLLRWLPRITNPALVVWGEHDRLIPVESASLWVEALLNARLHLVPEAGHLVLQEVPDTLKTIGDFLSE